MIRRIDPRGAVVLFGALVALIAISFLERNPSSASPREEGHKAKTPDAYFFLPLGSGTWTPDNPQRFSYLPPNGDYRKMYEDPSSHFRRAFDAGWTRVFVHRGAGESGTLQQRMRLTSLLESPVEIRQMLASTAPGFSRWVRDRGGSIVWYFGTWPEEFEMDEAMMWRTLAPWLYLGDAIAIDASAKTPQFSRHGRVLNALIEHCNREGIELIIESAPHAEFDWLGDRRAVIAEQMYWTDITRWSVRTRSEMWLYRLSPANWTRGDVGHIEMNADFELRMWQDARSSKNEGRHRVVFRRLPWLMTRDEAEQRLEAMPGVAAPYWRQPDTSGGSGQ